MKIATWNVNSLRVRLPHVLAWLDEHSPDVLCLQETKLPDEKFPVEEIETQGYQVAFSGQKTYNGVATISRESASDVVTDLPSLDDSQRRVLASTIDNVRIVNVYIPNGQDTESPKYQYKLDWLSKLNTYLETQLSQYENLVLLGDFNIAPEDHDVYDPEAWRGKVLCSGPEREKFVHMLGLGLRDCFRKFEQAEESYSWWDYRAAAFRRNMGLRIDHILASGALYGSCAACGIDKEPRKWERPSDHTPVFAEFS